MMMEYLFLDIAPSYKMMLPGIEISQAPLYVKMRYHSKSDLRVQVQSYQLYLQGYSFSHPLATYQDC